MTAVEWFAEELYQKVEMKGDGKVFDELLDQAKEMEEEQHNETWDSAHQAGRFEGKGIAVILRKENWQTFETYWDETFKSE